MLLGEGPGAFILLGDIKIGANCALINNCSENVAVGRAPVRRIPRVVPILGHLHLQLGLGAFVLLGILKCAPEHNGGNTVDVVAYPPPNISRRRSWFVHAAIISYVCK